MRQVVVVALCLAVALPSACRRRGGQSGQPQPPAQARPVEAPQPGPAASGPEAAPEADRLYEEGMNNYKNLPLPLMYDPEKMRVALEKFDRLIRDYPQSDKVDDALFYAAEILKEYFDENLKAVEYYRRAYEADPNTPHPAHFQRAVVLDFRLHRRDEALVEYRNVLKLEAEKPFPWARSNADFAAARIGQLSERR